MSTDETSNNYASEIHAKHNEGTGRKKSKEWNKSVAMDFSKELERLRNLRFEEELDGVDRGALK